MRKRFSSPEPVEFGLSPCGCSRLAHGLLFAALVLSGIADAAPYRPAEDAAVLERLPASALRADTRMPVPRDPGAAAVLAVAYIERSRRDGDPRFLGYAEGVLQPWWNELQPPAPILLLRATLLQSRHRFDQALRDLDALLVSDPRNAQALLTRATVLQVQGRYAEAAPTCERLRGLSSDFAAVLCAETIRGLNGGLPAAAHALDRMADASQGEGPAVRSWYLATRAEMA